MRPTLALLALALLAGAGLLATGILGAEDVRAGPVEGRVQLVKRTGPEFDRFTDRPTAATKRWINDRLFRSVVFTPYFDRRLAWHRDNWVYRNAYGIRREELRRNPGWAVRDAAGRPLFIPFGCARGRCPLYAADVTVPSFRRAWIAAARATLAKGYRGLWIDDVNLDLRTSDGRERIVRPVDRRTGRPLSDAAWRGRMAGFVAAVRAALPPPAEIVHNSIWYAGGPQRDRDPAVRRQIAAADWINVERGVNDAGLTGGSGPFALETLLGYVDRVHEQGRSVVLEGFDPSAAGRDYNVAAFLLVSSGRDGVAVGGLTPESLRAAERADLGRALGPRRAWRGLLRRDFERGTALVAPPESPRMSVPLDEELVDVARGVRVTRVTLTGGRGLVLRRP